MRWWCHDTEDPTVESVHVMGAAAAAARSSARRRASCRAAAILAAMAEADAGLMLGRPGELPDACCLDAAASAGDPALGAAWTLWRPSMGALGRVEVSRAADTAPTLCCIDPRGGGSCHGNLQAIAAS